MKVLRQLMLAAAIPTTLLCPQVHAQVGSDYPTKLITVVVPYPGDGSVTLEFRMYTQAVQDQTGARFVIDPRGGGGTTIGTAFVAKASPDGYTVLGASSPFTISPFVYPNLPYDPVRDFAAVTLLSKKVYLLVVHPDSPFRTLKEYLAFARANPGKLNFGTGGMGGATHLPGELLHSMTNTKATFIHYKRTSERITDVMAKRVDAALTSPLANYSNMKAGKLRPIAVTSKERLPLLPDVPTMDEQGVKGYDVANWVGLVAPAKVPPSVIARLHAMFTQATKDAAVMKKLQSDASITVASTPEQFRQHIVTETERWRKLIRDTGIKPGSGG